MSNRFKSLILATLVATSLSACQTVPSGDVLYTDPAKLAQQKTCEDIAAEVEKTNNIISGSGDSATGRLMKNTAINAAGRGVSMSGVLGQAGAFAGLGVNFLTGLYGINKAEREAKLLENAYTYRGLLAEAAHIKGCTVQSSLDSDW